MIYKDNQIIQTGFTYNFELKEFFNNIIYTNNRNIKMLNSNTAIKSGNFWKLDELQSNTYKIISNTLDIKKSKNIDITKPLNIKSETLNIKELSENTFDIELKENPTPYPCPKWKDVAFANATGYQINYELKNNTYYKIFYDNSIMISKPGEYPCLIKEFYWIKSDEHAPSDLLVNIPCIGTRGKFESGLLIINKTRIYLQNQKQLNIWKLQELQE